MATRILAASDEVILPGETEVVHPLSAHLRVFLPKIGDGTGQTVVAGTQVLFATESDGTLEILRNGGHRLQLMASHSARVAVAEAVGHWSIQDAPPNYPYARVTDGPEGGGGPHTHPISEIVDLQTTLDGKAASSHGHVISDTTGLQTALDAKADDSHTHVISDVLTLPATLDGKADDAHSHVIADTSGLQAALDAKADDSHGHTIGDTSGLQAALDAKADDSHSHAQSDITGLDTALAGKSDTGHTHAISAVTGLQTALDGKAASSHTHNASDITAGVFPIARLATGTPNGSKFIRDDGVLAAPAGGGGGGWGTVLDEVVLGANAATIALSWAGSFRRLFLYVELAGLSAAGIVRLQFNGDTGTTAYGTNKLILITTAIADQQVVSVAGVEISNAADVDPAIIKVEILNIPGVRHPCIIHTGRQDTSSLGQQDLVVNAGLWNNTAEITSMTLVSSAGNYLTGTRAWVVGY